MSEHTLERNHFPSELFELAIPEGYFLKTRMQSHKGEIIFQDVDPHFHNMIPCKTISENTLDRNDFLVK